MSELIPAILAKSATDLSDKISQLPDEVKFVHIDVLEEDFWTEIDIDFEAHLMVKEPDQIIDKWVKRGVKRIIIHELNENINKFRGKIDIGLAVELSTPIEQILPLIPQVDFVHLMSIAEIGEQGHPLDERIFDRIREVKERFPKVIISIDGGINTSNYQALIDLGINRLIVGSGFQELWKSLTKN